MAEQILVRTEGITHAFAGVTVLQNISVAIRQGAIFGIIGENGAGKSTFVKILSGTYRPTSGRLWFGGREVAHLDAAGAARLGIRTIPQEFDLVPTLNVAENIFLGQEQRRWGVLLDRHGMAARTRELLAMLRTTVPPGEKIQTLSGAQKQMVAIAKAVVHGARLLIMDEPTTALTQEEIDVLFDLMRRLQADGTTIVYISHKLREVRRICDEVMVLRDGTLISVDPAGALDEAEMARRMVGREMSRMFPPRATPGDEVRMRVEGLAVPGLVHDATFEVRRGEILGLAGLSGAGRTEMAEAVYGVRQKTCGRIFVDGREIRIRRPGDAVRHGIAYLSEDRQAAGIVTRFDLSANVTLVAWRRYGRCLIRRRRERERTEEYVRRFKIRTPSLRARLETLSGGNQQKVALAKGLDPQPRVFIFDEPTRGINVGARGEIYEFIHGLVAEGMACVLISSDLEEILGMCHKVAVVREGRIAGFVEGDAMSEEAIMFLATGITDRSTAHG